MAVWPTRTDLEEWLGPHNLGSDSAVLVDVLAAASSKIRQKLDPALLPTDTAVCPDPVRQAILLEAARLSTRQHSANGVIAAAGGDFAIRVSRLDPDVAALIRPYMPPPTP